MVVEKLQEWKQHLTPDLRVLLHEMEEAGYEFNLNHHLQSNLLIHVPAKDVEAFLQTLFLICRLNGIETGRAGPFSHSKQTMPIIEDFLIQEGRKAFSQGKLHRSRKLFT